MMKKIKGLINYNENYSESKMGNASIFKMAQPIFCLKKVDNGEIKRLLQLGLKEKQTEFLSRNKILKNKIINMIVEQTTETNQIAVEMAVKKLGVLFNVIYQPMMLCNKNRSTLSTARILAAQSDVVLIASNESTCLRLALTKRRLKPVINILNCSQCPALSAAAVMTIYEHYNKVEDLTVALIGRPYPYFNSMLLLLPRLNANAKILTSWKEITRISPRYFNTAKELADETGHQIQDCRTLEEVLSGSDIVMVSQNIWKGFQLFEKDIKKHCNKNWTFFHDPFEGPLLKTDLNFNSDNILSFKLIENLRWAYFIILLKVFTLKYPEVEADLLKMIKNVEFCEKNIQEKSSSPK